MAPNRSHRQTGGGRRAQVALGKPTLCSPGRPVLTTDDVSISFSRPLPSDVADTELVAVEHILGPALFDLLNHRDRDSVTKYENEVSDAKA